MCIGVCIHVDVSGGFNVMMYKSILMYYVRLCTDFGNTFPSKMTIKNLSIYCKRVEIAVSFHVSLIHNLFYCFCNISVLTPECPL